MIPLALMLALSTTPLRGHPAGHVKHEVLRILNDRIVLTMNYNVSEPRYVTDLRERFDRDADRRLSGEEKGELVGFLQGQATRDLHLSWDGNTIFPRVESEATSGLDRDLPSAYPIRVTWRLQFFYPAGPEERNPESRTARVLRFEDSETQWGRDFHCEVRIDAGFREEDDGGNESLHPPGSPRIIRFPNGRGSFSMRLFPDPSLR